MTSHWSSSRQQTAREVVPALDVRNRSPQRAGGGYTDLDTLAEAHAYQRREQAEWDLDEWEDLDAWMGYGDGYD